MVMTYWSLTGWGSFVTLNIKASLISIYIYIYVHKYKYKYYERKKRRNYISRQACFVNRFTLQGFKPLLQRIEHCYTRKSTCRLPKYKYKYIFIYTNFFFLFEELLSPLSGVKYRISYSIDASLPMRYK